MILVVAEQRDGVLNRAALEAVAAGQALGSKVTIVLPGREATEATRELAKADVTEVISLEHAALADYTADGFVAALAAFIPTVSPELVIFSHTYQTRDFAPRLAARLDRALVTDCTGAKAGTPPVFSRQMFQGKVAADVTLEGPAPHFATFQIGSFRADAVKKGGSPAPVKSVAATVDAGAIRQKPEAVGSPGTELEFAL